MGFSSILFSVGCLGFSISHVTFSEVTSVWGISAVAILDCSLNVYACGRQKALTMPTYCVAANRNNSQATQSITMYEFQRNRPAVRRKWVKFVQLNELTLMLRLSHAHLCGKHFAECDFVNFISGGIPNGVCFKAEFVGLSTGLQTWKKIQFESPRMKLVSSKSTA